MPYANCQRSHLHAIVAFRSPSLCVGFVRSFGTRRDLLRLFSMQHNAHARCAFLLVTSVRMAFYYDDEYSLGRVSPKWRWHICIVAGAVSSVYSCSHSDTQWQQWHPVSVRGVAHKTSTVPSIVSSPCRCFQHQPSATTVPIPWFHFNISLSYRISVSSWVRRDAVLQKLVTGHSQYLSD